MEAREQYRFRELMGGGEPTPQPTRAGGTDPELFTGGLDQYQTDQTRRYPRPLARNLTRAEQLLSLSKNKSLSDDLLGKIADEVDT